MLDLRLAIRNLIKSPGFAFVAILTLALGVGANTAIFSVVKAVLLNQLPYREPDRLVAIAETSPTTLNPITVDFTTTYDLRERSKLFESMSLYRSASGAFVEGEQPELFQGMRVGYDFFDTLGVKMILGRTFTPADDRPDGRFKVILSHGLWVRKFGADPNIIGRVVRLTEQSFTVVGVLPENYSTLVGTGNSEMFMPLAYQLGGDSSCRGCQHLRLIARMKPGVSAAQANAELTAILEQIKRENVSSYDPQTGVRVMPLRDRLFGNVSTALWVLLAAVGLVLLIACVNVANLLLARANGRAKEIALRAALGAGRARIVRQLLAESLLLAIIGGVAGIALATGGVAAFAHFAPKQIPRIQEVRIDRTVLLFSFAISLFTGALFGLAPALRASRVDLAEAMKGLGKSTEGHSRIGMRNVLVVAELALAFVLVVGAGLLAKSFTKLMTVNPGYDPHNVLTLGAYVYSARYAKPEAETALYDQVMTSLRATPGVEGAAMTSTLPLSGGFDRRAVNIQDRPLVNDATAPSADAYSITPDYFRVMRIPLLRGRSFTNQDRGGAPLVAVVSESCARTLWPREDAIGKHIQISGRDNQKWAEIVGIVGDIRQYGLDRASSMEVYIPLAQNTNFAYTMVVRTAGDSRHFENMVRAAFAAADKTQPVFNVQPLEDYLSATLAQRTFTLALLGALGMLAITLAAVGIYGVISYAVSLRTREVGIRMALGARANDVMAMILRQGLVLVGAGLLAGFAGALALTRFLTTLLYEVRPADLATWSAVSIALTVVAMLASFIPARRAMRVDPMVALRQD